MTRRKLMLAYYLLRDPLFARHTRPVVERWRGRLGAIPLVGLLADKAAEILLSIQGYYTYTSAS